MNIKVVCKVCRWVGQAIVGKKGFAIEDYKCPDCGGNLKRGKGIYSYNSKCAIRKVDRSKMMFIAIFLIGLVIGALTGSLLLGQVIAGVYHESGTELYYLKNIMDSMNYIEISTTKIERNTKSILWELKE